MPKKQSLDLFADEGQDNDLDLFAGRDDLDLFADEKYSVGKDLKKLVPETGKAVVQTYENFAKAMGGVVNWVGENIANDEPINYTDPLGKQQTIELKKSEFHKKFGQRIAADGQRIYDFWDNRMKNGWEAPDKELFEGEYFENPSVTRTSAMLVNGLGSLATALVVAKATNNPAFAAQAFGLVEGQESRMEARRAGKSVRESNVIGGLSAAGNAVLEVMPIYAFMGGTEKALKKGLMATGIGALKKIAGKLGVKNTPKLGREMMAGMVIEGGEEGAQQFWTNLVAKLGYEDTRDLGKGVIDSILGGALAGGAAIPSIGAAKGLDSRIQGLKKKGLTDSEVGTMATMLSKQMLANAPAVDDALKKEVGLFEQKIEGPSEPDELNQQFAKFAEGGVAVESDRKIHEVEAGSLQEKHQVSYREIDQSLVEGIKITIKTGGLISPIIVNQEADGSLAIITGHHRVQAYKELGIKTIPAMIVKVSDAVAKKMAVLDNEGNKDTPSIYGRRYRRLIEQGLSLADAIEDVRGFINNSATKDARLWIGLSYLPTPIQKMVDMDTELIPVASTIGYANKKYDLDLTSDVIMYLINDLHLKEGAPAKKIEEILEELYSNSLSRTNTKERTLDLFGKLINNVTVRDLIKQREKAVKELEKERREIRTAMRSSTVVGQLKAGGDKKLFEKSEQLLSQIAEFKKKLLKFQIDDFVGAVKEVVVSNAKIETSDVLSETLDTIKSGKVSTKYLYHLTSQKSARGILEKGLLGGGVSGTPLNQVGYGDTVVVLLRDPKVPIGFGSDVSLVKGYTPLKAVASFPLSAIYNESELTIGLRASEEGYELEPPESKTETIEITEEAARVRAERLEDHDLSDEDTAIGIEQDRLIDQAELAAEGLTKLDLQFTHGLISEEKYKLLKDLDLSGAIERRNVESNGKIWRRGQIVDATDENITLNIKESEDPYINDTLRKLKKLNANATPQEVKKAQEPRLDHALTDRDDAIKEYEAVLKRKLQYADDLKLANRVYKTRISTVRKNFQVEINDNFPLKGEVMEITVESGSDGTFYIPDFKTTQEAIAFGKLNRMNPDGVAAIRAMLKNIQKPIMDSLKTGDLERSTKNAEKAVLLTAALAAAEGKYDNTGKPKKVVNKIATKQQKEDLLNKEKPDEEKKILEDAQKSGVADKAAVILASEEAPGEKVKDMEGPLKRAAELREKR